MEALVAMNRSAWKKTAPMHLPYCSPTTNANNTSTLAPSPTIQDRLEVVS